MYIQKKQNIFKSLNLSINYFTNLKITTITYAFSNIPKELGGNSLTELFISSKTALKMEMETVQSQIPALVERTS